MAEVGDGGENIDDAVAVAVICRATVASAEDIEAACELGAESGVWDPKFGCFGGPPRETPTAPAPAPVAVAQATSSTVTTPMGSPDPNPNNNRITRRKGKALAGPPARSPDWESHPSYAKEFAPEQPETTIFWRPTAFFSSFERNPAAFARAWVDDNASYFGPSSRERYTRYLDEFVLDMRHPGNGHLLGNLENNNGAIRFVTDVIMKLPTVRLKLVSDEFVGSYVGRVWCDGAWTRFRHENRIWESALLGAEGDRALRAKAAATAANPDRTDDFLLSLLYFAFDALFQYATDRLAAFSEWEAADTKWARGGGGEGVRPSRPVDPAMFASLRCGKNMYAHLGREEVFPSCLEENTVRHSCCAELRRHLRITD
jgi:hypothetical protein